MAEYLDFVTIDIWTMIFIWINMIILFLIVKKFLFKPVTKILEQRQGEIDTMYVDATSASEKAKALENEYNEKIMLAKDEAGEIVRTATLHAKKREDEILNEARQTASAMTQKASMQIEQEKKKAYQDIKSDIASLSVSIAEKIMEKEINEQDHQELIAKFIENVGEDK